MGWKEELPSPNEIKYANWPRATSQSEYASATIDVVRLVGRLSKNASIYQVGGVSAPGISDLDFVVVLNDHETQGDFNTWGALTASFSPTTRYVIRHKPLIVNPELWRGLSILHTNTDYRHISGPILPPPVQIGAAAAISHLFGEIEKKLFAPLRLERYLLRRSVNVRRALKRLAKLKGQISVLGEFGIVKASWSNFGDAVSKLREDWFSLNHSVQIETLYQLISTSAEIDADLILEMSKPMLLTGLTFPEAAQPGRTVVGALDYGKIFVKDYQPEFRLRCLVGSYRIGRDLTSVLPATFMLPALIYAAHSPTLGNVFHNRLTVFGEIPDVGHWQLPQGIADRISFLDQYLDFISVHRYSWGLFFATWSFPKRGPEECRRYWQEAQRPLEQSADVLPFLLRKRVAAANPDLAKFVGRMTTNAYLGLRHAREKFAPPGGRRDRVVARLRVALAMPFRTTKKKT